MYSSIKEQFSIVWALTKRDYAIQFAGSTLGFLWVILQSITFIVLYLFLLTGLGLQSSGIRSSSTSYVVTGILFWLPLQECILRGTVILTENRQLLKKTGLGVEKFLQVPMLQMFVHFGILSVPSFLVLYLINELNWKICILSVFWYLIVIAFLYPLLSYLARANVLLRDISPIIRLFIQVFFWASPIIYFPPHSLQSILSLNPIFGLLEIFRYLVIKNYPTPDFPWSVLVCSGLFAIVLYNSKKHLNRLILDQL